MITFSNLGKKGNLGNQLFQIASTIGIAQMNNQEYKFPTWEYAKYFKNSLPSVDLNFFDEGLKRISEEKFHFYYWKIEDDHVDINGWLQTEKYFFKNDIQNVFLFKESFQIPLLEKFKYIFEKRTILISIRRGDFVNNPKYFQLTYKFYFLALLKNFPDWRNRNLIFASDDIAYCKFHFSFLPNSFFLEDLKAIEQLAVSTKCDDYIISNSTFSWWIAWLGEKESTRIVRPIKNFRGRYANLNSDKDYFPGRWIAFNEKKYHIPWKYLSLVIKGTVYHEAFNFIYWVKYRKKDLKKWIKRIIKKE